MDVLLWSLLGVVAGACIAVQAPINAQLGRDLGFPIAAAAISFLAGAIVLIVVGLIVLRVQGASIAWLAPAPWLYFAGGCLGTVYVTSSILLTPRIGAAAVMGLSVAGQLLAGIVLDRIGVLNLAVREISLGRIAGAVLLVAGAVLIRVF
ncbi:MAG TPA: DMT family transporter [Devosiaceae bacterium]|jgi:transporter family-2 protein